eukprot:3451445-Prymnesium_polylepis.1
MVVQCASVGPCRTASSGRAGQRSGAVHARPAAPRTPPLDALQFPIRTARMRFANLGRDGTCRRGAQMACCRYSGCRYRVRCRRVRAKRHGCEAVGCRLNTRAARQVGASDAVSDHGVIAPQCRKPRGNWHLPSGTIV